MIGEGVSQICVWTQKELDSGSGLVDYSLRHPSDVWILLNKGLVNQSMVKYSRPHSAV